MRCALSRIGHPLAERISFSDIFNDELLSYLRLRPRLFCQTSGLRRVEFAISLFDATGLLVPGDGRPDMVWPSPLACSRDFALGLAISEGEHLIVEAWARLGALTRCFPVIRRPARAGAVGPRAQAEVVLLDPGALAVPRQHTLSGFQLSKFTRELFRVVASTRASPSLTRSLSFLISSRLP